MIRDGKYYGELKGGAYYIQDELAETFYKRWSILSPADLVNEVLHDIAYWGEDLASLPDFAEAVTHNLNSIINCGIRQTIEIVNSKKVVAA